MNGLTPKDHARISALIARHAAVIDRCRKDLGTNFEVPAQRIINAACYQMGCSRLDWEKIVAVQADWEFTPIPKHILARWEAY